MSYSLQIFDSNGYLDFDLTDFSFKLIADMTVPLYSYTSGQYVDIYIPGTTASSFVQDVGYFTLFGSALVPILNNVRMYHKNAIKYNAGASTRFLVYNT